MSAANPRPCAIHPHRTGGEIKTIGETRFGDSRDEQVYARWAESRGETCACEKPKPFAVAVQNEQWGSADGWDERVEIAEPHFAIRVEEPQRPREVAAVLCAAVEQREAKLVGGWRDIARRLWKSYNGQQTGGIYEPWFRLNNDLQDLEKSAGPGYVPENEAASYAMLCAQQQLVIEELQTLAETLAEARGVDVLPFLEAKGLDVRLRRTPLLVPDTWHLTKSMARKLGRIINRPVLSSPVAKERLLLDEEMTAIERRGVRDFVRRLEAMAAMSPDDVAPPPPERGTEAWTQWERLLTEDPAAPEAVPARDQRVVARAEAAFVGVAVGDSVPIGNGLHEVEVVIGPNDGTGPAEPYRVPCPDCGSDGAECACAP